MSELVKLVDLPPGECVTHMAAWNGVMLVATGRALYELVPAHARRRLGPCDLVERPLPVVRVDGVAWPIGTQAADEPFW